MKMAITQNQFRSLGDLFDYYNEKLFGGVLPGCLLNMSRKSRSHGFFAWDRWRDAKDDKKVHEISLNPDTMNRPDREWHSTLVHEMCHLWQQELGNKVRRAYHDKQFAAKMEEVGLMTSTTGAPGGKRTGQNMTHYIIEGGAFDLAFEAIEAEQLETLKIPYKPAGPLSGPARPTGGNGSGSEGGEGEGADEPAPKSLSGVKIKYSCGCGYNVWGKPGLKIDCGECDERFQEQ